jgi:hypothetical protein
MVAAIENRLFGRFFAMTRVTLQTVAQHPGLSWVANLTGCLAR